MPIPRTLNHHFFKTWTPEMAYVLGYFAADGCMIQNKRGGFYIEFTSTDKILIDHVQRATGSNHTISVRKRGENTKVAYRIQFGSKAWFDDLSAHGFTPGKSNTMPFPDVPAKFIGDFVRGYFDGDGCVYFNAHFAKDRNHERWVFQTQFISGSKDFLTELWLRLRGYGINGGHIYVRKNGACNLVFSWKDSLALYMLMYHTCQVAGLFLPRKRDKFQSAIKVLKL